MPKQPDIKVFRCKMDKDLQQAFMKSLTNELDYVVCSVTYWDDSEVCEIFMNPADKTEPTKLFKQLGKVLQAHMLSWPDILLVENK